MDWLTDLKNGIDAGVWIALVGVGVFIAIRTRFIQFMRFGRMWRETVGRSLRHRPGAEGDVTPFQAMTVAMGGTVGVGNIAGVATAIASGGPGAIFWMWVSGLLGMGTKFAEVVLGLHYRRREAGGPMVGGPMMYIRRGMGSAWGWLAAAFAIFGAAAAFGIGNMVQANAVAEGTARFGVAPLVTGLILLVAVGLVTVGGIKRIAQVATVCVPFMCILYMLAAFVVILLHAGKIPGVLGLVVREAFSLRAAGGGLLGTVMVRAMRYGLARGVFSNEAGLGSAPIAHATAMTDHPARQGMWGIFEVFVDTIVICSLTALVILLTGVWERGGTGASLTMNAFAHTFGEKIGFPLVVLCMILTAYDTNLAWCFYGETCAAYLFGHGGATRMTYRVLWLPFIVVGALWKLERVWDVADILNALMAIPNLLALVVLSGVVVRLTRGFLAAQPYAPPQERDRQP